MSTRTRQRRAKRRRNADPLCESSSGNPAYDHLHRAWMLRCLCCVSPRRLQSSLESTFISESLLRESGIQIGDIKNPDAVQDYYRQLQEQLALHEGAWPRRCGQPFDNLDRLRELLRLTETEAELCLFAATLESGSGLKEVAGFLTDISHTTLARLLAWLLNRPLEAVRAALRRDGPLHRFGLVRSDEHRNSLRTQFDILEGLESLLLSDDFETALLQRYARQAPAGKLKAEDFAHLNEDFSLLANLLQVAVRERLPGVNVLIHGPPGTGKTELARALAVHCGVTLYEIGSHDEDGDPLKGDNRVRACGLMQRVLDRREDCALLFDEAEDVFPQRSFNLFGLSLDKPNASGSKAWMNQLLESNPRPCFRLSNAIGQIDPAFLRRFDYVLELDLPPRSVRERLLRQGLNEVPVSEHWLRRMAELEHLSPALIERAGRLGRFLDAPDEAARERQLTRILGNTLRAMGQPHEPEALPALGDYDLSLLNTGDADPAALVNGLVVHGQGRLCLYGPPGTGKSEFAAYLCERLERPLVRGRASELLDRYVGGTEHNIARLFERADREQAVLVIDEVDSLLQDRRGARHAWEITQVNELLTRMERFEGVLVCTTNRMDGLDPAVLRRFDCKLKLDYLNAEQCRRLFCRLLGEPPDALPAGVSRALARLDNLTPGDFALVRRKLRLLHQQTDVAAVLRMLDAESRAKPDAGNRPIGFVH